MESRNVNAFLPGLLLTVKRLKGVKVSKEGRILGMKKTGTPGEKTGKRGFGLVRPAAARARKRRGGVGWVTHNAVSAGRGRICRGEGEEDWVRLHKTVNYRSDYGRCFLAVVGKRS